MSKPSRITAKFNSSWETKDYGTHSGPINSIKMIKTMILDYSLIDDVKMHVNTSDAPDFCDSYIESATYAGRAMTEEEIEMLNEDADYIYEQVIKWVY